jgi:hypothetical protein
MANDLNIVYKIAADISGLQDGVKRAAKAAEGLETAAVRVGNAMARMFTVSAAASFAKAILADADALVRLSDQTGVSIQRLQMFRDVGNAVGVSYEAMARGISKMNVALGQESDKVAKGLERIGLSMEDIQGLSPENSFIAIANAVAKVENPLVQAAAANEIFGGRGAELLPVLKKGFEDVADSATRMSDEVVRAVADAGDTLESTSQRFMDVSTILLAELIKTVTATTDLTDGFNVLRTAGGAAFGPMTPAIVGTVAQLTGLNAYLAETEGRLKELQDLARTSGPASRSLGQGQAAPLEVPTLDSARVQKALQELQGAGERLAAAQKKIRDEIERSADATRKWQVEIFLAENKFKSLADAAMFGMRAYIQGLEEIESTGRKADGSTQAVLDNLTAFGKVQGVEDVTLDIVTLNKSVEQLGRSGQFTAMKLKDIGNWKPGPMLSVTSSIAGGIEAADDKTKDWNDSLNDLSEAFAQLAEISGGAFGGAAKAIGTAISAINVATTAMGNLNKAVEAGKAGWADYAAAYTSVFSVIMQGFQMLSDVLTRGMKARDAFGAEVNATIRAFTDQFVDARTRAGEGLVLLEEAAARAGISTERFMAALAALDNGRTPAALREIVAAIDELNAALERQKEIEAAASKYGPTQTQLKEAEQLAFDTLQYMQKLFDAGEVTQAQLNAAYLDWQKAMADAGNANAAVWVKTFVDQQRRMAAAGDEAAKAWLRANGYAEQAASTANAAFDALKKEYDDLAKSVENEAPEEVMGVVEAATRAKMEALAQQMEAANRQTEAGNQETLDATVTDTEAAADKYRDCWGRAGDFARTEFDETADRAQMTANAIVDAFKDLRFDIPISFSVGPTPSSPGAAFAATGGIVTTTGIQRFTDGGIVMPRGFGTDTVPAMLTPGEWVVNEPQQDRIFDLIAGRGAHGGGAVSEPVNVHNTVDVYIDGERMTDNVITRVGRNKRGAGTRMRRALAAED